MHILHIDHHYQFSWKVPVHRYAGGQRLLICMTGPRVALSDDCVGIRIALICISRIVAATRGDLRQIGGYLSTPGSSLSHEQLQFSPRAACRSWPNCHAQSGRRHFGTALEACLLSARTHDKPPRFTAPHGQARAPSTCKEQLSGTATEAFEAH